MNRAERRQSERAERLASTRHRHARQPRDRRNPIGHALVRSTALMPHELDEIQQTLDTCIQALRTARHTEDHITVLQTHWLIAAGIEESGIVRGLGEQIAAAQDACTAIRERSEHGDQWWPSPLYAAELTALQEMAELHLYQIRQLSAGEIHTITKKALARHQSAGGVFKRVDAEEFGLTFREQK